MRSKPFALAALLLVSAAPASAVRTLAVPAAGETAAVASAKDAADDPAIWRNPVRPEASLIVATDKQAGLYVYGLDGKVRSQLAVGRVNNVDLRDGVMITGRPGVLVAASDRTDVAHGRIALFELNTSSGRLRPLGETPVGAGEAYGFCLWLPAPGAAPYAFVVMKDGTIVQTRLDLSGAPAAEVVRTVKLATQAEGCVADDRTGQLYVAEEDVGLWRLPADPMSKAAPAPFARVDGARLVADAEGVAIAPSGRTGGALVVSSQGDSAYAAYRLPDGRFLGRFRIAPAGAVDGTSDTDGVEIALGDFGPAFPQGLMVAQDGDNAPEAQNFKLVDWRKVRAALRLP